MLEVTKKVSSDKCMPSELAVIFFIVLAGASGPPANTVQISWCKDTIFPPVRLLEGLSQITQITQIFSNPVESNGDLFRRFRPIRS